MIKLVEKHLPDTTYKEEVIEWMGKSNPELALRSPSSHRAWRCLKEDIFVVERWMDIEKKDHAWARFEEEGGWPRKWPSRLKLAAVMVIMAERTGEFRPPPTIAKALATIKIDANFLSQEDHKRAYHHYWPSAMLWEVDPRAMPLDQWIRRFRRELWTWNEKTTMMDPPPALKQKYGATSVRLVMPQRFPPPSISMMMREQLMREQMMTVAAKPKPAKEDDQAEEEDKKPDVKLLSQAIVPVKRPATGILPEQPDTKIQVKGEEVDRVTRIKNKLRTARRNIRTQADQVSQLHRMIRLQEKMIGELEDRVSAIEERDQDIVQSIEEDDW